MNREPTRRQAPTAAFGQPGVLRAVLESGLYLAAPGLLDVALGTLLRHPAAAIGVLVAVVLVLPGIAAALPPHGSRATSRSTGQPWPAHR